MTQSNQKPSRNNRKRASVPGAGGSITIEAALSVPIFFFAVVCLIYFIEICNVQRIIYSATVHAAKICIEDTALVPVLNTSKLEAEIVRSIGADRLESSIVNGGSRGIQCAGSYCDRNGNKLHIVVRYGIRLPFLQFGNLSAKYKEEMKFSNWNGFEKRGMGSEEEQIVYITKNGLVYHENYQCTYLQLSVRFIPYAELGRIRNEDGGRYYKCEKCVHGSAMAGVYITNTGGKYHNSLMCSGLSRTIYAVQKSKMIGRGGCSRCTK